MVSHSKLRSEWQEWLLSSRHGWDVGICLHVPNSLRVAENGWDERWLQRRLSRFFNQLDRRIHKAAHRNRGVRVARCVALERTDLVGWHAHAMLATPTGWQHEDFIQLMRKLWHEDLGSYRACRFENQLFWAEPISNNYGSYSTKHCASSAKPIYSQSGISNGWVDGMIDLQNTVLSNQT